MVCKAYQVFVSNSQQISLLHASIKLIKFRKDLCVRMNFYTNVSFVSMKSVNRCAVWCVLVVYYLLFFTTNTFESYFHVQWLIVKNESFVFLFLCKEEMYCCFIGEVVKKMKLHKQKISQRTEPSFASGWHKVFI